MMALEVPEAQDIAVGALGNLHFSAGWYVYCGSAQKNLRQRVARHSRKVRKQQHWHLDYLTPYAASIKGLPIMSEGNLECDLARSMRELGGIPVQGFGSSDCRCDSHLFFFDYNEPPMRNRAFVDTLLRYRSQF
jgi:sugar fermentation stimulation protein A